MESSSQYTVFSAELSAVDGFSGRILPYVNALDDRYFCAAAPFSRRRLQRVVCIYADDGPDRGEYIPDPKVSETIDRGDPGGSGCIGKTAAFGGRSEWLYFKQLRQCDGAVRMPGRRMAAIRYAYNGLDIVQIRRWTEEIRETTAEDQKEAARIIRRLLEEAWIVTTGNRTAIEMDQDCFDRIRDFRSKMAE